MAEETLIIETPEHVELHFALATIGNRFLACAIDHLLQIATLIITYIFFYNLSAGARSFEGRIANRIQEGNLWIAAALILVVFVIIFGYFVIFETIWSGQTPGKRWLRLRVIRDDGRPINFFASLTRNLLRGADIMPFPFYSLGIITVFASERSKRIGDFVAGTVVVKERATEAPSFDEVFESEVIDTAMRRLAAPVEFRGDVRVIEPQEIEVVEAFLRRRGDLPEHPRQWLAWRVAMPLLEKIRPSFDPAQFSYEGFLEELLARYRVQVKYKD
ncbi:MAG TPA: RDD family protein [Blastocatellia bacterium]|nr:RDD family protein [Blastocatellia bacterium]